MLQKGVTMRYLLAFLLFVLTFVVSFLYVKHEQRAAAATALLAAERD